MNKKVTEQSQTSGDNSQNVNVGRDLVYLGMSYADMREIALDVYRENILQLSKDAGDIARGRAEKVTEDFLKDLLAKHPQSIGNLSNPDVQFGLFNVQEGYARSGVDELGNILVDLLTERASITDQSLEVIVLNEAIVSAPKLTEGQRITIAIIFILKYTTALDLASLKDYYSVYLPTYLYPLIPNAASKRIDFQHIEYVGAGSVSISSNSLASCIKAGLEGFYMKGFNISDVTPALQTASNGINIFIPCERNPSKFRLDILSNSKIEEFARSKGVETYLEELRNLAKNGSMPDDEILSEFIESSSSAKELSELYSNSSMSNLVLTSTGIALGHAHWKRITRGNVPLSVWL